MLTPFLVVVIHSSPFRPPFTFESVCEISPSTAGT